MREKREIAIMILNGETEAAITLACERFGVAVPKIRVGLPKREGKAYACYQPRNQTIYFADSDALRNPFVAMHEFYHHLRIHQGKHRGTEKHADAFAETFVLSLHTT